MLQVLTSARGPFILWVQFRQRASEPRFPELLEPGVSCVVLGPQGQIVRIERMHVRRVDPDGDAAVRLLFVTLGDIATVGPTITVM